MAALDSLFAPEQYNFAFLMNLDTHVHVVPGTLRRGGGETYTDPHFGSLFGTEERLVTEDALVALSGAVRERL